MKKKIKFKTGTRSTCLYCGSSVAHNVGTETDIYCHKCKKRFEKEDMDVFIMDTMRGRTGLTLTY